ncbi:MAG: C1 family peptidase, partial [Candidatus Ratteibacteria bacterium]
MTNILSKYGMGWIPDYPDIRDYTQDTKEIKETFGRIRQKIKNALPEKIDLRQWCSPVDNQGSLGSCTA